MKNIILGIVIFIMSSHFSYAQARPLETLKKEEFLQLSEDFQSIYIAGILDGKSFVLYNYQPLDVEKWTSCVRLKTLGETTEDVVSFLKNNPDFAEPVPWAVAQVIGSRNCPH